MLRLELLMLLWFSSHWCGVVAALLLERRQIKVAAML
jgi:hypothetical protein